VVETNLVFQVRQQRANVQNDKQLFVVPMAMEQHCGVPKLLTAVI
jgi:hypothetical protein